MLSHSFTVTLHQIITVYFFDFYGMKFQSERKCLKNLGTDYFQVEPTMSSEYWFKLA